MGTFPTSFKEVSRGRSVTTPTFSVILMGCEDKMKPLLAVMALVFIFSFGCSKVIVLPDGNSIEVPKSDIWKKITPMADLENNKNIECELLDNVVGLSTSKTRAKKIALTSVYRIRGNAYRDVGVERVYYDSALSGTRRAYEYEVEAYKCEPIQ